MFLSEKEPTKLEIALDRAFDVLMVDREGTEEYEKVLNQIIKLHKMKEEEKPSKVNPDTWVMAGVNLLGILLIIRHEHVNVITSRAMGLVLKPR